MKKILVTLSLSTLAIAGSNAAIIWNAGKADDAQEFNFANPGAGTGGENVVNIREFGGDTQTLPGLATNVGSADGDAVRDVDDDYYFAGLYSTTVGSAYTGVGAVAQDERVMERAWTAGDNDLRFHFNFPAATTDTDLMQVGFGLTNGFHEPDVNAPTTWSIDVSLNGVLLSSHDVNAGTINADFVTPTFTAATVGGAPILANDYDNYVTLTANRTAGTGNWVSLDYAQMDVTPVPEPSSAAFIAIAAAGIAMIRRRRR